LKIFTVEYLLTLELRILQTNHHSINQQIFNNLKQNQQCSLSKKGRLRDDNIFFFFNQSRIIESLLTS